MKPLLCFSAVVLAVSIMMIAQGGRAEAQNQKPKASSDEDSYMFGRILAAVEDLGGGYTKEALHRYKAIVCDLEKRDYSSRTRWMAYDGYGRALTASGEKDKAIEALLHAIEEVKALGDKERAESAEHMERARNLK